MADDQRPTPSRPAGPRPLGGLGDLSEVLGGGDADRSAKFLGGLMVGALVGAAIAGTALMRRRRRDGRGTR